MLAVQIHGELEVPAIGGLSDFRRWVSSDRFPERGRVDYLCGCIEVDMSPEDLHTHGSVKVELVGVIWRRVKQLDLGELYADRARVSCAEADLSAEPDIVLVTHEALETGRVRLVPTAGGEKDRYIELEGCPDLIVEIASDASVRKDTERLPAAYWRAGVREYWLVDARAESPLFRIQSRGETEYQAEPPDSRGFQSSAVLGRGYRLERTRNRYGRLQYTLHESAE